MKKRMGQALPSRLYSFFFLRSLFCFLFLLSSVTLLFSLSFVFGHSFVFSFFCLLSLFWFPGAVYGGKKIWGAPLWPRGLVRGRKKFVVAPKGAAAQPLPWPSGPHVAG